MRMYSFTASRQGKGSWELGEANASGAPSLYPRFSLCPLPHGGGRGGLKSTSLCKPPGPEIPPGKHSPSTVACAEQRAAKAAAANNVWRHQSPRAFDRQNLNRPSTQRGLTQLPPSPCLSARHKNARFVLCWRRCSAGQAIRRPSPRLSRPRAKGQGLSCPSPPPLAAQGQGLPSPLNARHQRWFDTTGTQPAFTDGRGAEFSVQETVEKTKALPRLIQLMSLHPIKQVIFSSCSAQEPHGRVRLPGQRLAALNHLSQPACRQPAYSKPDQSRSFHTRKQVLVNHTFATRTSSQFYAEATLAIRRVSSTSSTLKSTVLHFERATLADGDLPNAKRSFLMSPNISQAPHMVWKTMEVAMTLCGAQGAAEELKGGRHRLRLLHTDHYNPEPGQAD